MITKSAEKNVHKAIKARLKLNDAQTRALMAYNWDVMLPDQMHGCVALVEPASTYREGTHELRLQIKNTFGYYETVATFNLTQDHLVRWNALSIEEAYALPEGYVSRNSTFAWTKADIISVAANKHGTMDVVADVEGYGQTTLRTEEGEGMLEVYAERIGKTVEMYVDMNPPVDSANARLLALIDDKVLPLIYMIRATYDEEDDLPEHATGAGYVDMWADA